ncbi:MAG: hypothetical protein NZ929_03065 [Aigarchaeota archaeon]|nr:hypothetical protein [Aigarchaeota archaeon]MCX8192597.1 hypothetical protein [Nitrososphaeria archaeon]MDW7985667.1 hypothetical protein [Nitrososphaerota archaeon]
MACFLIPLIIAIITTFLQKRLVKKIDGIRLDILNTLLWGGVSLLAVEHIWHGEITPWPPFLTAMANPVEIPVMITEMVMIGVPMSISVFTVWGAIITLPRIITILTIHRRS